MKQKWCISLALYAPYDFGLALRLRRAKAADGLEVSIMDLDDKVNRAFPHSSNRGVDAACGIFLDMGKLLLDDLDFTQRMALKVAENYLNDKEQFNEDRKAYSHVLGDRLDHYLSSNADGTRDAALNRIVWCSLNRNGGLNSMMGELAIELSELVGLKPEALDAIFSKRVLAYRKLDK